MQIKEEVNLVFLAYINDSGTGDRKQRFQLMTSVVVADSQFRSLEITAFASLLAFIPSEKADKFHEQFEEFKGWQLFRGKGPFEGIEDSVRFKIIEFLLAKSRAFPIIFGALDKPEWEREKSKSGSMFLYGGANPDDICFRACLRGVGKCIEQHAPQTFALVIADDIQEKSVKDRLRAGFYSYRERLTERTFASSTPFIHDDMYFGDSRYSIGIQLADLCGYFIARRLEKDPDPNIERFFKLIENRIAYSQIEPGGKMIHARAMDGEMKTEL